MKSYCSCLLFTPSITEKTFHKRSLPYDYHTNACKYYHSTCAFHIQDLSIADGQIIGLLGENGAGKTSLLKSLVGLTDYSGSLLIDGKPAREQYENISFITEEGKLVRLYDAYAVRHVFYLIFTRPFHMKRLPEPS